MKIRFILLLVFGWVSITNAQETISGRSNTLQNVMITNAVADNTAPTITVLEPSVSRGFVAVTENQTLLVKIMATDQSGVSAVTVNNQQISAKGNNIFEGNITLALGQNTITVAATDNKGNVANETFTIQRNGGGETLNVGKFYALIIGNNNYTDPAISSLAEPINDATKLYNVLTQQYTFEPQNVTFLKNATYEQMIEAFDNLQQKVTTNDNLLVFYAGHGYWNDDTQNGYWLPCNAKKSSTAYWIRNSTISEYMSSIRSRHTLLIADACFSGSIFKTRSAFSDAPTAYNRLYELPSRSAMTSGNLKEVPDKSKFLEYLVKRLTENTQKYMNAEELFVSFRVAVMNNSDTEPQFGTIQNAGDEGGEFIFVKR